MKLSEIIKVYINEHEISAREFARKANLSNTYISNMLNGSDKNPSLDALGKIAKAMGISSQKLFDCLDGDQMFSINYTGKNDYTENIDDCIKSVNIIYDDYFPLHYCTNLSGGSPTELLEAEPDAVVYVPIKFQGRKKRLHAFQVNGTSMNNIIQDGSIVVAEEVPDTVIREGTVVVAWYNGEATVKRIYPTDHQVTLMPDSTDKGHQPIIINTDIDKVYILGRVIWHMNPDDIAKYY